MVIRLFMTASPSLVLDDPCRSTRNFLHSGYKKIELFRYWTVAQVEQNAISAQKISNKRKGLTRPVQFSDVHGLRLLLKC
jgi:hypothetical protein